MSFSLHIERHWRGAQWGASTGDTMAMPRLSFFQLTKVFIVGFIGYALVLCLTTIAVGVAFPDYVKLRFDMSVDTFFEMVFFYFGIFGLVATFLMLIGAWCILRLVSPRSSV